MSLPFLRGAQPASSTGGSQEGRSTGRSGARALGLAREGLRVELDLDSHRSSQPPTLQIKKPRPSEMSRDSQELIEIIVTQSPDSQAGGVFKHVKP